MRSSAQAQGTGIRVRGIAASKSKLMMPMPDGHTITLPLAWYSRPAVGAPKQWAHWELASAFATAYRFALIGAQKETGLPEGATPAVCPRSSEQVMAEEFLPGWPHWHQLWLPTAGLSRNSRIKSSRVLC